MVGHLKSTTVVLVKIFLEAKKGVQVNPLEPPPLPPPAAYGHCICVGELCIATKGSDILFCKIWHSADGLCVIQFDCNCVYITAKCADTVYKRDFRLLLEEWGLSE